MNIVYIFRENRKFWSTLANSEPQAVKEAGPSSEDEVSLVLRCIINMFAPYSMNKYDP